MSVAQELNVLEKIRTRGYWRVVVRPTMFEPNHVPNDTDLFPIVERNSVRLRGWDYPHIDYQKPSLRGTDWVGQEFDCQDEIEVWRLYTSGQFIHFFTIWGDWRDYSTAWPAEPGWMPGRSLLYTPTVFSLVEIFEFAARLALSPAGAVSMHVGIELKNLEGRRLVSTDINVPLSGVYLARVSEWSHSWEGSQTELIAKPRELAAEAARNLLCRFGLDLSPEVLARVQARIGR